MPRVPIGGEGNPSNPERQRQSMKRTAMIKVRVSESEKTEIEHKAQLAGLTLFDFIRRMPRSRTRQTQAEREHLRLLARAGNNLNQLARWANTYKSDIEAVRLLVALESLRRVLVAGEGTYVQKFFHTAREPGKPPSTTSLAWITPVGLKILPLSCVVSQS